MTSTVLTWHCSQRGEVNNKVCSECWLKMTENFRKVNDIMARSRPECKDEHFIPKQIAPKGLSA